MRKYGICFSFFTFSPIIHVIESVAYSTAFFRLHHRTMNDGRFNLHQQI
jgi:hypothetical protein